MNISYINDKYKSIADDFINSYFGVNCELIYTPIRKECDNCIFDTLGHKSSNIYNGVGPQPFSEGLCPYCFGIGFKLQQITEIIKLRVNWSPKPGIKGVPVNIPENAIQIIGFLSDLPKVLRCASININSEQTAYNTWTYIPVGEAITTGLGNDRYFALILQRGINDV